MMMILSFGGCKTILSFLLWLLDKTNTLLNMRSWVDYSGCEKVSHPEIDMEYGRHVECLFEFLCDWYSYDGEILFVSGPHMLLG
jgi:hypothetical protein